MSLLPSLPPDDPTPKIKRLGSRTWGPMAWRAWLELNLITFEHTHGTYAWTERGARRKVKLLLKTYRKRYASGPEITVEITDCAP